MAIRHDLLGTLPQVGKTLGSRYRLALLERLARAEASVAPV